ncbi:MAG TPA: hypothetical protein PLD54_01820, partial [Candidatus Levybacteria bacterium]|nr:hypothetical protein [Candidatus Levybacteria bacterium]
ISQDSIARAACGTDSGSGDQLIAYTACRTQAINDYQSQNNCVGTPLYLYGTPGINVAVSFHTPTFNTNVPLVDNKFKAVLSQNGEFQVGNTTYQSVTYDYTPAVPIIKPPRYGYLVANKSVKKTVRDIAKQFGFNEKETNDIIRDISAKISSPYAFISFYDQQTSHAILPITFNPKPDVYRNIVFYVKNLDQKPNYSIQAPQIEKINRYGFTAIEISHIAE